MKGNLTKDISASVVVFLVALPLCLGIALASGASLFSGLIAGIVGGIVVGTVSGSSVSVSGPAAGLTVIVLAAINDLGYEVFLLAVVLAGVIQIIMGYAKAGVIGYYFPSSVIKGMLSAIGLILILKQIPHALGYDADYEGDQSFFQMDNENTFSEIFNALNHLSLTAIIISAISLAVLILFEQKFMKRIKLFQFIPGALIVVVGGALINFAFASFAPEMALDASHMVQLPVATSFEGFIGQFTTPDFSGFANPQLYVVTVTIALVASLESLLCIEAADKLDPHKRVTPPSKELKAQGWGNLVSGLIGGLPVTAVIVRSSANIEAGATTKRSAIFHGVLLLICAATIPTVLNYIPLSALAAVLLLVGYKLVKPSLIKDLYSKGVDQFVPFAVTVIAIMFTDLLIGIGIGLVVGIIFVFKSNFPRTIISSKSEGNVLIRFNKNVYFINKAQLSSMLGDVNPNENVTIDASSVEFIDHDISELLEDFKLRAEEENINVKFEGFTNENAN